MLFGKYDYLNPEKQEIIFEMKILFWQLCVREFIWKNHQIENLFSWEKKFILETKQKYQKKWYENEIRKKESENIKTIFFKFFLETFSKINCSKNTDESLDECRRM